MMDIVHQRVSSIMFSFMVGVTLCFYVLSVRCYAVFPSPVYVAEMVDNGVSNVISTGDTHSYESNDDLATFSDAFVNLQYLDMDDLLVNGIFTVKAPTDLSDQYCVRVINTDNKTEQFYKFVSTVRPSLSITAGSGNYCVQFLIRLVGNKFLVKESVDFCYDENCVGLKPYVEETLMVPMSDKITDLAQNVTKYGKTKLGKVRLVEWYLAENMYYDYVKAYNVKAGYKSNPNTILDDGCGICVDYATLMTSMLRSIDIPTRMVWGYINGVYHAWVEVAIDGSWLRFDPTLADTKSGYRMNFDSNLIEYIPVKYF